MPPDGWPANEKSETDALKYGDGDDRTPAVAAVRLAQEASDLNRTPVVNGTKGVRDVTQEFIAASERLPSDELVKDEYFTLFEAVGALEIMDPKMDSGYVPPDDLFEPDFDASRGLEANEVLWIIQELVRFEMTFHDGYPLSQNIFTSLHVFNLISPANKYPYQIHVRGSPRKALGEDPAFDLVHVVLRAYCIALLKCVQLTLQMIQSQTFYEEEDFVTFLYGRELLPRLGTYEAQRLLTEAIGWVEDANVDPKVKQALISHLELRQSALTCMDGEDELWSQLKSNIAKVEEQQPGLSKPIPSAFSDKVQRQLATSTPPRPMPSLSSQDACSKWKQLCDDIYAALRLTSHATRKSPHNLQNATWVFAYREPPPNTYARAKMQDILIANDAFGDDLLHFDHLLTDMRELVLAGDSMADPAAFQVEVPTDPRHICSRMIEDFMTRAIGEYLNLFRMVCQNRCRMRRTFTQAIPLLDEIESEAQIADQRINEVIVPRKLKDGAGSEYQLEPMTLWSRYYKLQITKWIIQLGFETDIYLPDELGNMYMLLIDFVDRQREDVARIKLFAKDRLSKLSRSVDRVQHQECRASVDWLDSLIVSADTNLALASALAHLYAALEELGIIDATSKPFSDPKLRYEARMKPLLTMASDAAPSVELLQQRKQRLVGTPDDVSHVVKSLVSRAKSGLAELKGMRPEQVKHVGTEDFWRADLKRLKTVCVAITVAASELVRVAKKHGEAGLQAGGYLQHAVEVVIPAPGKRYHDWWVVPQLKERSIA